MSLRARTENCSTVYRQGLEQVKLTIRENLRTANLNPKIIGYKVIKKSVRHTSTRSVSLLQRYALFDLKHIRTITEQNFGTVNKTYATKDEIRLTKNKNCFFNV